MGFGTYYKNDKIIKIYYKNGDRDRKNRKDYSK